MTEERRIYAAYDDDSVIVYQAFKPRTVAYAVEHGTFGLGFNTDRMTWIKPSFGWMLYRSGYATKKRQDAIARVYLTHEGFLAILRESIETMYNENVFESQDEWRNSLKRSAVRHQWDPERYLTLKKHPTRRAIQIGIDGWVVNNYLNEWIIKVEDATELAHEVQKAVKLNRALPDVPQEQVYPVDDDLAHQLNITSD